MIYVCQNCHFLFERIGVCDQCPDCGKDQICEASDPEKAEYAKLKEERNASTVK